MTQKMTNDNKPIDDLGLTYLPSNPSKYSSGVLRQYDFLKKQAMTAFNRSPYSPTGEHYNNQAHEILNQAERSRRMIGQYDTRQSYLRIRAHELATDLRTCEENEVDQILSDMEDVFSEIYEIRENISQLRRNL